MILRSHLSSVFQILKSLNWNRIFDISMTMESSLYWEGWRDSNLWFLSRPNVLLESIGSSDIDFSNLVHLDLSQSEVTETVLALVMSKVGTELKVLKLDNTKINLAHTSLIPGFLPNLEELYLSFFPLICAFITFLNKAGENLNRLHVHLRETPVT